MPNPAHLHLLLTHAPIVGLPLGFLILLIAWARRSRDLQLLAAALLLGTALLTVPLYLTGEPAEESIEAVAGTPEMLVDRHEDAAVAALALTELTGVIALMLLVALRTPQTTSRRLLPVAALFALAATVAVVWTATLGGEIRHTELRSPRSAAVGEATGAAAGEQGESAEQGEHD